MNGYKKTLIAIDFDHTIVDANSDVSIKSLVQNSILPDDIDQLSKHKNGWTHYMREIFRFLHQNGIKPQDYYNCLSSMPVVPGIKELLLTAHASGKFEIIVLSDANSVFINHYLKEMGLEKTVSEVFTNAAAFDEQGCLTIQEYQEQDHCQRCTRNICKGAVLLEYLARQASEGVEFERVAYIGDGSNDVCPALKLGPNDFVFPRSQYVMCKRLRRLLKEDATALKAALVEWSSGSDIQAVLLP